jgi:hypothetical protein
MKNVVRQSLKKGNRYSVHQNSCHEHKLHYSSNTVAMILRSMPSERRVSQDECDKKLSQLEEYCLFRDHLKGRYSFAPQCLVSQELS